MLNMPNPVKRLVGSALPITDPIESIMSKTLRYYDSAIKGQIHLQLLKELNPTLYPDTAAEGMGKWAEEVDPYQDVTRAKLHELLDQLVDDEIVSEDKARLLKAADWIRHPTGTLTDQKLEDIAFLAETVGVPLNTEDFKELIEASKGFASLDTIYAIYRPHFRPDPRHLISRVVVKGKPHMIKWQSDLYQVMMDMDPLQLNAFQKVFSAANQLNKLGWVGLNTLFAGRNMWRDWQTFQAQTKFFKGSTGKRLKGLGAPFFWMGVYINSQVHTMLGAPEKRNELMDLWLEMGGFLNTYLGLDTNSLKNMQSRITTMSAGDRIKNLMLPRELWGAFQRQIENVRDAVTFSEVGPRLAEFAASLEADGYVVREGKLINAETGQKQRPPRAVVIRAVNAAADVTTNFTRIGSNARMVNRFMTFFNANLESQAKQIRTIREAIKNGQSIPDTMKQRVFVFMAAQAAATIVYWLYRHDDDDYKAQPAWLRHFWTFTWNKKPVIRFPMPYEYNIVPMGVMGILDSFSEEDIKPLRESISEQVWQRVPGGNVPLIRPLTETAMNKDWFRWRAIESEGLQREVPEERYYSYTLPLSKMMGQYTGKHMGIGPARLEHLLRGTTGDLYFRLQAFPIRLFEAAFEPDIGYNWSDTPYIGGFVLRKDYVAAVDDFYKKWKRIQQEAVTARRKDDLGHPSIQMARDFKEFANMMSALREGIKDERDRDRRFETEKYIAGLAREALKLEPLDRYPSPFYLDPSILPDEAEEEMKTILRSKITSLTVGRPTGLTPSERRGMSLEERREAYQEKVIDWRTKRKTAHEWLKTHRTPRPVVLRTYIESMRDSGYKSETIRRKVRELEAVLPAVSKSP
jgi:hypothetical protein